MGGTQAIAERFDLLKVFAEDEISSHLQSAAYAFRLDQWIAIAVSSDPGAKLHQVGQRAFLDLNSVDLLKRLRNFCVDFRKRIKNRKPEIPQAHSDFIVHSGLGQANFV